MISPSHPDPASSSDPVDRGLAAGFGPRAPESVPGDSVLAALARRGGATPHVLLRDAPGDELDRAAPLLRPLPPAERERAAAGRYQFQGEIAHGGMGVILKGHDQDLGRDVAIKVLHERFKDDGSLLRRFVEEAQIGGQLQHPGIVPVYELGLHEGRPFFTMKLIKGRTLGALLAERSEPGQDRRRYLGIFEQVCQTVAYAHARGVIHRDLKPANVMVGTFGEVQVVDWGMAKVLAQGGVADEQKERPSTVETVRSRAGTPPGTSSVAGSVMGTPSYMPPEQAKGDLEHMDERSDVFALGAILCEILTGAPLYAGARDDVLAMAAQGKLEAARARLARCEIDAELSALVSACLSPAVAARPRNAQAVAERVSAHLASAEQRAQDARIAAAEQGVKAREARRAQRLTLALAVSVLVTLLVGGGGWSWIAEQRAARGLAIARQVDEALAEATRLRGRAEAGTEETLALWSEARTKAEAAQALAASGDATPALRARVAVLVEDLERGETAARRTAEQRAKDRAMVARLEEIPIPVDDELGTTPASLRESDARRREDAYASAWAWYGIDLQAGEALVAERMATSAIAKELALALDDWSMARKVISAKSEPGRRLLRIARRADPDPWRNRLRDWMLREGDGAHVNELRALPAEADRATLPACTLLLLGRTLAGAGASSEATHVLQSAQRQYPSDFLIAFALGYELFRSANSQEAVRFLTAAVAIRPRNIEARHRLGLALVQLGDLEGALAVFRSVQPEGAEGHWNYHIGDLLLKKGDVEGAIATTTESLRMDGRRVEAHNILGCALLKKGEIGAAIKAFREATVLAPDRAVFFVNLGSSLGQAGDLDGAIVAFRAAILLEPGAVSYHRSLGTLLQKTADFDGAAAALREATRLDPDYAMTHVQLGDVLREKRDLDGAIAEYRTAIRLDPRDVTALNHLATAQGRKGDLSGAIATCREALRLHPQDAIAHHQLGTALRATGDVEASVKALREAIRLKPDYPAPHFNLGNVLYDLRDLDGAETCFRETTRLLPDHAQAWCNLGRILRAKGLLAESLQAYEHCHELGSKRKDWSYPSAEWLDVARILAQDERPLLAIVHGQATARDGKQAIAAAACAMRADLPGRAALLYAESFAADPRLAGDLKAGHRDLAARMAAMAGCGKGAEQLTDETRASWRQQARRWLRDELEAWRRYHAGDPEARRTLCERTLQRWQEDVGLAGLRDPTHVEKLPAGEQTECQEFWRDVQALLDRARGQRPPESRR